MIGMVSVESWANPKTQIMDFQVLVSVKDANGEIWDPGESWPEERDNLRFIAVEKM